jgi:hypothetical protein
LPAGTFPVLGTVGVSKYVVFADRIHTE